MSALPPYFLPRPPVPTDAPTLAAFDALWAEAKGRGGPIDYRLGAPKWQFLCHLADSGELLLHGSGNPGIALFEPRKSDDLNEFGDRQAIYAASDGIWTLYFAILDRDRYPMSLINSATRLELGSGQQSEPFYFFSISQAALTQRPFRRGTIYLLPRVSFEAQPAQRYRGADIRPLQWASPVPVKPLAQLAVGPEDFPFLDQLRGHDDEPTFARARANPDGFPWVEEDR